MLSCSFAGFINKFFAPLLCWRRVVGWETCGEVSALGKAALCFSVSFPENYFME